MSAQGGSKAIVAALGANVGIAVAKFVAFLITGSTSLLAESVHSLADSGNQGLLLLGGRRAKRPASEAHPFGHGRERYFWAFIVALVLFSAGGLFAIYEGVERILHPEHLASPVVGFAVLGVSIVLEGGSLRTALQEIRHLKPADQSYAQFVRRTKVPELAVVFLEDLGALVGLALALLGLILAEVTGEARFDGIGSISIGLLLAVIASVLARETKSLLMGEPADAEAVRALTTAIEGTPSVRGLIHLRTLQLGPDDVMVAAKVELDPSLSYADVARTIDAAEVRMRAAVPAAEFIFIEPDVRASPAP